MEFFLFCMVLVVLRHQVYFSDFFKFDQFVRLRLNDTKIRLFANP